MILPGKLGREIMTRLFTRFFSIIVALLLEDQGPTRESILVTQYIPVFHSATCIILVEKFWNRKQGNEGKDHLISLKDHLQGLVSRITWISLKLAGLIENHDSGFQEVHREYPK